MTIHTPFPAAMLRPAPTRISHSQVSSLHPAYRYSCPRKWGYRTLLGQPEQRSFALAAGSAFDEGANCYFTMLRDGTGHEEATSQALLIASAHLEQEVIDSPTLFEAEGSADAYQALIASAFVVFAEDQKGAQPALVQDQHDFVVTVGEEEIPVMGYSDRVEADGTVIDHKFSGSARWTKDGVWDEAWVSERRGQLVTYYAGRLAKLRRWIAGGGTAETWPEPNVIQQGRLVVTYAKVGLLHPQVRSLDLTGDQEDVQRVVDTIAESWLARKGPLPMRPGEACRWCDFVLRCRGDQARAGTPFLSLAT